MWHGPLSLMNLMLPIKGTHCIHRDTVLERLTGFIKLLRDENFLCNPSSTLDAVTVSSAGYIEHRLQLRQGLRACLCHSRDEWQRFDALFDYYWQSHREDLDEIKDSKRADNSPPPKESSRNRLIGFSTSSDEQDLDRNITGAGDFKTLSLADFRFVFDKYQMQQIEYLVDALTKRIRRQRRRRTKAAKKSGRLDLRRSQQRALATGGTLRDLSYRQPIKRLPSFVLLLDVSQSMEIYSKMFLRFTRQLMSEFDRSMAFAFNTTLFPLAQGHSRLTELDFENAMNEYGKGWLGGTRIAKSFDAFNSGPGRHIVDSHTTVVIFSDGYDTDKPEHLIPELQILKRRARRTVWVNPLLGRFEPNEPDPKMDPLQPHLDHYCSGHNLDSLFELGKLLTR